ncbi:hypothetical protein [Pararhizobium haloflavum]|uniref:hypothetical protein n=1 Tax=Pararhizobium haloflavum TaxID=2037914 RepID=UPI0012FFDAC7|nr:hypothetical protein [Pararhizobium haloflavum]
MTARIAPHGVFHHSLPTELSVWSLVCHSHLSAALRALAWTRRCIQRFCRLQSRYPLFELGDTLRQTRQAFPNRHLIEELQDV